MKREILARKARYFLSLSTEMKNKKNILILLPIVVIIWGAVAYQIYNYLDVDDEPPLEIQQSVIKPLQIKKQDTIAINTSYRDPFLDKTYSARMNTPKITRISEKPKTSMIQWPSISYKGIVSDTKDKNKVFMLIIDGKTSLLKIGQAENDIRLKSGDRSSVTVTFKGQSSSIPLQQ